MKSRKLKLFTLSALLGAGLASCSSDDDVQIEKPVAERVEVYNDFNGRITYHNEPLEAYDDGSGKKASSSGFTYVADISAPVLHGRTMSATGIAIQGNKAYVSYHWNENEGDYAGAIEVIDISQPAQPSLISGMYFMDTDLNELDVQGNEVYAVGGRSLSSSGYDANITSGGVIEVVRLQGGTLTNQVDEAPIPAFSGNSVFRAGNNLYVASGNTGGGAFELDLKKNNYLNVTNSDYYDNSKYAVNEGSIYAFLRGGSNSELHIHNSNNFNPGAKTVIPLSSPTAPEDGKKVMRVDFPKNTAYVSSGSYGLHAYDVNDPSGTAIQSFTTNGNGLVNGVDYDHNYVFAAKGSEGLYILDKNTMSNILANFAFTGSANYVKSSTQNVFIAHGRGGLKILAKNSGVVYGDPYCTNNTVFESYSGSGSIVRLTAMGNYLENGEYGKRWRIRNETSNTETVYWDIYGTSMTGTFEVPANSAIHFTSHKTNSSSGGGTMRLYSDPGMTNQIQVKAHGGSTKNLDNC